MLMQGWICPICGAGVSPFVEVCPNCRKYYYVHPDINTPTTPWKPTITCTAIGSMNTTSSPNVHCGGLVGTEKCSVAKVNLGDRKGYLQGQNAEELPGSPLLHFINLNTQSHG